MNQENTIDNDQVITLFREIFKSSVTDITAKGQDSRAISPETLLEVAREFSEKRQWYLLEAGADDLDLSKFDALMKEYLEDLQKFLSGVNAGNEGLSTALHQLFS